MVVHSSRQDRQELGLQQEAVSTFKYVERVLTCRASSFFVLLKAPPFISGVKHLHDGEVSKYPLASVSSVKKSASNQPCFHSHYTDLAIQYLEVS